MEVKYVFWQDKKFWAVAVDTVSVLVLYFVGKYASANILEDLKVVWAALQPLVAMFLYGQYKADKISSEISAMRGVLPKGFKQ